MTPREASCLHTSSPIPLFPPVTTATLKTIPHKIEMLIPIRNPVQTNKNLISMDAFCQKGQQGRCFFPSATLNTAARLEGKTNSLLIGLWQRISVNSLIFQCRLPSGSGDRYLKAEIAMSVALSFQGRLICLYQD